jgi:structural maintenance of chromosomes protein 5
MVLREETAAPGAKRSRVDSATLYTPGSIIRVEVKNFMTYSRCTIEPGPTLNLVLGPNGTGKSSLVCALCVGLAGSTKLLGRADDVGSYIRRGTSEGYVTVTIAKEGGGIHVITRKMKKASDGSVKGAQSDFSIDGKACPMAKVKDLVKRYNIQLDNLCQFLPQDKVNEFARMKPVELLKATEQAIGEGELYELHQSLIDGKKQLDEKTKLVELHQQAVDRHRDEMNDLEQSLGPIREKKQLKEDIEVLEKHRLWKVYDASVEGLAEDKSLLKKAKNTLQRIDAEAERIANGPVKEKTQERQRAEKERKEAAKKVTKNNIDPLNAKIDSDVDTAIRAHNAIESLNERSRKHREKIQATEYDVQNLKEVVQSMANTEADQARQEIEMIGRQITDLGTEERSFLSSRRNLEDQREHVDKSFKRVSTELREFTSKKVQLMHALEQSHPGTRAAHEYVKQNKSRFRGQVLGPLALEIDVQKPYYARILEQHIPHNWLLYYVVEYEQDLELLKKELEAKDICPYITVVEGDQRAPLKYLSGHSASYSGLGVAATLDETFQCHPMIKHALDSHFNTSSVFVMEQGKDGWEEVLRANPHLEQLYTDKLHIRKKVSRYDQSSVTISVNDVKASKYLHSSVNDASAGQVARLQSEQAKLKEQQEQLDRQMQDLQPDIDRITMEKKQLIAEKQRLVQCIQDSDQKLRIARAKLKSTQARLESMKKQEDPLAQKDRVVKDIQVALKKVLQSTGAMSKAVGEGTRLILNSAANDLVVKELTEQIKVLGKESIEKKRQRDELAKDVERLEDELQSKIEESEKLKKNASDVTGWPIPDDLKETFDGLPKTLEEVDDVIGEKRARHDAIIIMDPSAQKRYDRIALVLSGNVEKLEEDKAAHAAIVENVERLKEAWLPEIRRLVHKINGNFSEAFRSVGIAGEVVFNEVEGEDFANYSIDLRVKFREQGQLITLDSAYHSGGESSTSTILYLMALQGVTTSPFRVVDEINQGMDSVNERQVFKLLCDAATAPDTPQCFLLTPKLLPDLPFSKDVTVLQIMNGVHIGDVANGYKRASLLGTERINVHAKPVQA